LTVLAPHLNDEIKPQILQEALATAREIKDEYRRTSTLTALTPYLNGEKQITILQELLYMSDINLLVGLLKEALNIWKKIEFKGLKEHILPFIKFKSQRERKDGVGIVGVLSPALVHFSGEEIVPELYRAITDTARWWR
jgi:hypothetical protein